MLQCNLLEHLLADMVERRTEKFGLFAAKRLNQFWSCFRFLAALDSGQSRSRKRSCRRRKSGCIRNMVFLHWWRNFVGNRSLDSFLEPRNAPKEHAEYNDINLEAETVTEKTSLFKLIGNAPKILAIGNRAILFLVCLVSNVGLHHQSHRQSGLGELKPWIQNQLVSTKPEIGPVCCLPFTAPLQPYSPC